MKALAAIPILIAAAAILWWMPELDTGFVEASALRFGPVAIVALVALGIVVSPIPSGVVAMAAGALYGTIEGGALTVAGAVIGAACAFLLSRHVGRDRIAAHSSALAQSLTRERSQNALMLTVFATRLIPFISFDAISYIAGLTPLAFWRFAAATAAGTTPVCIAFAAAGSSAISGGMSPLLFAALCGVTLILPMGLVAARRIRPVPSA